LPDKLKTGDDDLSPRSFGGFFIFVLYT
jgi:hypothetical protein